MSKVVNNKVRALLGAVGIGALSMASPASAASFNSSFSVSRFNSVGSSFANMSASATSFCFLTRVGFAELDVPAETAQCRITRGPVVWTLEAVLGSNGDHHAVCSATCYNN